jgi:hypothetical protein
MVCSCYTREALRLEAEHVLQYTYAMRNDRPHRRAVELQQDEKGAQRY